jgi:hypothetical protein
LLICTSNSHNQAEGELRPRLTGTEDGTKES